MEARKCYWFANIEGSILFICSNGDWIWTKDNLITQHLLRKENYRGQLVKRIPGTSRRLTPKSIQKAVTPCNVLI